MLYTARQIIGMVKAIDNFEMYKATFTNPNNKDLQRMYSNSLLSSLKKLKRKVPRRIREGIYINEIALNTLEEEVKKLTD